ncbi:hypothetical protein NDI85_16515 [Halomicroarcula sp. S1AR25-4]|uniref:hypothetical protein n=1 Tax=Haloarcula sp. S1AR25-4 TaxID=2950538 RepID=UPI00287488F3|nr:hypothetical protein [Halomicroarcula sp. S1AR25-4]MDS0279402.1 hypothetical protein [Halomicroarcula sp. S1AR25-4]
MSLLALPEWLVAVLEEVALGGGALLLVCGGLMCYVGWDQRQTAALLADADHVTPAEAEPDTLVRLRGTVATTADGTFASPIADRECVLAGYEIDEQYDTPTDSTWEQAAWGVTSVPFAIEADGDRLLVDVEDTVVGNGTDDVFTPESVLVSDGVSLPAVRCRFERFDTHVETDSGETPPPRLAQFLDSTDGLSTEPLASTPTVDESKRRYREGWLRPGDEVSVLGTVSRRADAGTVTGHPDELVLTDDEETPLRLSADPLDGGDGTAALLTGLGTGAVGLASLAAVVVW